MIASNPVEKRMSRLTMATSCAPTNPGYSYLPTPDGSVEGLGIICDPAEAPTLNEIAIDVAYETAVWESQIDCQIRQFQQAFEQKHYLRSPTEAPLFAIDAPGPFPAGQFTNMMHENNIGLQEFNPSRVSTDDTMASFGTSSQTRQYDDNFHGFEASREHNTEPARVQLQCDNLQIKSPYPVAYFSNQNNSLSSQSTPYNLSTTLSTPYLQPSAAINEGLSRRLSVSSNASSSVFSGDCQRNPYFMTPCTTPYVASSTSTDIPCTPISSLSSPVYPSHSRSPSSSSLKAPAPTYRPIRPAPYAMDAAQRQRWSTGKTMSLPSRRTQLPDYSFPPGHMRAVSENIIDKTYSDESFANGDRTSFNQNLEIIRRCLPTIIQQSDEQQPFMKTEAPSESSCRPILAPTQLRIIAPLSVLSQAQVPPLDLPKQLSRPASPTFDDLFPSDGPAPTQNPVSPLDTYTAKYKRGTRGNLQGFCGLCKPGRWLNMKNSAYWYDKNYKHGINSKTRRPFDLPVDRRWKLGSSVIREGLCGFCNEWTRMDSCKMSWTNWFKHAYKCHNEIIDVEDDYEDYKDEQGSVTDQLDEKATPNAVSAQYHQPIQRTNYVPQQPWL